MRATHFHEGGAIDVACEIRDFFDEGLGCGGVTKSRDEGQAVQGNDSDGASSPI